MPTITPTGESFTVIRDYSIADAEPMQRQYNSGKILPDQIRITFRDGKPTQVSIVGASVKKDGSLGVNSYEETYYLGMHGDVLPAWVRPLLEFQPV